MKISMTEREENRKRKNATNLLFMLHTNNPNIEQEQSFQNFQK
jgi:hypothetical protein